MDEVLLLGTLAMMHSASEEAIMKTDFELCVERSTGKSIEYLRETPIDEQRLAVEAVHGKRLVFKSYFPLIGRGNVLHNRLITHDEAEAALRKALRHG